MQEKPKGTVILNVEDDDSAYQLLVIAFEELALNVDLHRTIDGEDALRFLHRRGSHGGAPRPALILMNLNLPKMTGLEVLEILRRDLSLSDIPVVMFTSSSLDSDKASCLALGAKAYITKPMNYPDVLSAVHSAFVMAAASG